MTLTPADVRLELIGDSKADTVRTGKRRRRDVTLLRYRVLHGDKEIGEVGRRMATFEQRTPGRMYVNSRWTAPRWYYEQPDHRYVRAHYETRKAALIDLIWAHNASVENNA